MLNRHPDYYPSFHCLGGSCPDTCCRDWDIVLDPDTLLDYQQAPAPLSAALAQSLATDQEGDTCFRLDERGFCTMLTPEGLCAIQKEWGASHLCGHCAAYPRFIEEFGHLTESSLALSCPEAARLILESPHFTVVQTDDGHPDQCFPSIPPDLIQLLDRTRAQALAIIEDLSQPLWTSVHQMVQLAHQIQLHLDREDYALPAAVSDPGPASHTHAKPFAERLVRFFATLEPLRSSWPEQLMRCCHVLQSMDPETYVQLCRSFETQCPWWQRHLRNVMGYLLFRHWHKAVNDDQLYPRAAWISCSAILLYHLFLCRWMEVETLPVKEEAALCSAFSREVEHMEENLALAMETCACLSPSTISYPPM